MKKKRSLVMPEITQVEKELQREKYRLRYFAVLRSTVYSLLTVAAIAILAATLWMPVLRIYGSSMSPTLEAGEIVLSRKNANFVPGDIVAFYYNNKILIKRVIGTAGDWIDITEDGTVYVNGEALEEPYLTEKALGDSNIEYPYQVPEGRVFVLGDHRSTSVDSRNTAVGCIAQEMIVGKVFFRVWPLNRIRTLN